MAIESGVFFHCSRILKGKPFDNFYHDCHSNMLMTKGERLALRINSLFLGCKLLILYPLLILYTNFSIILEILV